MKQFFVDAFTDEVFSGNPAAVCILQEWLPDTLMQLMAAENNLSETAFAVKEGGKYHIRWFTPSHEVDLCGHATLASAYVISRFYESEAEAVYFISKGGDLTVHVAGEMLEMDFPARRGQPMAAGEAVAQALGCTPKELYLSRDIMAVLESEEQVAQFQPNFESIAALPEGMGLYITAPSQKFDFVSRCFFPKINVNEDPVCGSAHCSLIPYWAERLGKTDMVARQLSPRGGTIFCKNRGERVSISGKAVLYATANILIGAENV